MFDILGWIIIGLLAGGIASLIVPGRTPCRYTAPR